MRRTAFALLTIALLFGLLGSAAPLLEVRAQGGTTYVVKPGDTLFRIALQHGVSVDAIVAANNLPNRSVVYVGQVLTIPGMTVAAQPAEPAAAVGGVHVVARGESLSAIARRYGVTLSALLAANSIPDPNRLVVGQQIVIPAGGSAPPPAAVDNPPAAAPTAAPAAPAAGVRTHVVKRGEGLARIASQYGVSWQALANFNNISNPNLIYVGMVLRIPAPGSPEAAAPGGLAESRPAAPVTSGKLILVVLREQRVYAYQNGQLLQSYLVSTGLPRTPTVQGQYKIYLKYRSQTMYGPGYYLPNVPYVMYFYQGYGLHGTYWHSNFGRPMSHGCVNLRTPDAEWLFNWAEVGTPVHVRY
ncbi:MAG: LysM peptidoglycan-binding domain-containing protein [Chloroflexi bacterium CFX4]|nr:LysM peptidoglycan-binding domain-containing protein [Chloroflexi bacterium CFX4]MDL1924518.1 LysM peptidoglycan-binding domain-containing protein [Chloroflexi bacterium CFX3]